MSTKTHTPNASDQAFLDLVLLDTSALLVVSSLTNDFREGVRMARESVLFARVWDAFVHIRDMSVGV